LAITISEQWFPETKIQKPITTA